MADEFLHDIDVNALKEELKLDVAGIAKLAGISENGVYKWSWKKSKQGTRPSFNAIVSLLQNGATQETLFGIKSIPKLEKNESKDSIDYEDPKFLEAVRRGMAIIDQQMKEKRAADDESNQKA